MQNYCFLIINVLILLHQKDKTMEKKIFRVQKGAVIHFAGFWLEVDKDDTTKCCLYSKKTRRVVLFRDLLTNGKMRDIKNYWKCKLHYSMFLFNNMSEANILLLVELMRMPTFYVSVRNWEFSHMFGNCKVYKKGDSQRIVDEFGKLILNIN